jgi:hypothetical protein
MQIQMTHNSCSCWHLLYSTRHNSNRPPTPDAHGLILTAAVLRGPLRNNAGRGTSCTGGCRLLGSSLLLLLRPVLQHAQCLLLDVLLDSAAAAAGGAVVACCASGLALSPAGSSASQASAVEPCAGPLVKPNAVKNCQAGLLFKAMSVTTLLQGCLHCGGHAGHAAGGSGGESAFDSSSVSVAAQSSIQCKCIVRILNHKNTPRLRNMGRVCGMCCCRCQGCCCSSP